VFKHLIAAAGLLCSIAAQATPVVSLTAPANGTRFLPPAAVTLTANASDPDDTIARVDFYSGTTLIGTAATAPYTVRWTEVSTGTYAVTATAVNSRNESSTATPVNVIVNTPPTATVAATIVEGRDRKLAAVRLESVAADADGTIARVEFYEDGILIGTRTTAPYVIPQYDELPGTYRFTARAIDNLGGVAGSSTVTLTMPNVSAPPDPAAVTMIAPVTYTSYFAPADIVLEAAATEAANLIVRVDFYEKAPFPGAPPAFIGTASAPPYRFTWRNLPEGKYNIFAKATDSQATVTTSASVLVFVNRARSVGLTSPFDNAASYAAPASIALAADVADSDGTMASVEFINGTTVLATVTAAPYAARWEGVAKGSYTIRARATDRHGVVTLSAPVTVQVVDNAAPTVRLRAPLNNAAYPASAPIELVATATDTDGGITKVDFFDGATLLGTVTAAPYTFRWTNATAGSHAITARATDNAGAQTTSAAVTVSVTAAANLPPTVSMIATPTNATAPATILLNAAANDADGSVAKVDFFNGSTLLASVSQAPYTYNWMNVTAGSYTITAKATDDGGAVTVSEPAAVTVTAIPAASQVYYIDSDHLNTPRVITDASNRIVWQWENSDPFGDNLPEEDPGNTGNTLEFNLRFPGQYFDRETGLHYNYFRDYDPSTGRYVESDPLGLQGGINTYTYVNGNPLSNTDSEGLNPAMAVYRAGMLGYRAGEAINPYIQPVMASALDSIFFPPMQAANSEEEKEYAAYKEFEKNRPAKGPKCDDFKRQLDYWRTVEKMRTDFANKWYGGTFDPGHMNRANIAREQIKKYEKALKECKDDCP
jgi:RHS repeat-associated protein